MSRSIKITGMGAMSAAGMNAGDCMRSMKEGIRNSRPVSLFDTSLNVPVFEIVDFESQPGEMRTVSLLNEALRMALDEAGLTNDLSGLRVGICFGTTVACQLNNVEFYAGYRKGDVGSLDACDVFLKSNLGEATAERLQTRGPATTVANACSSGADAIGVAWSWLQAGLCDIAIAGGADEMNRIPVCGFHALGVTSDELCAPFDRDRKGLNLGEAAGVVVLETAEHAAKRGVSSSVNLCGYGASADAHHLTAPQPEGQGLIRAIESALRVSNISPDDIAFINAHGTATRDNDKVEGNVLPKLFGDAIKVLSTKGYTGHTLGAAGAIEAVFTAMALQSGSIPASPGFQNQDEEIPLIPVRKNTAVSGNYALSTSLAFGGNNAALILGID